MGDPVTLGAMGLSAAGSLISGIGAKAGGSASSRMYQYQSALAWQNAQTALQNAAYARNVGEQEATKAGMAGAQRGGAIKAAQSSSGLDVNTGSARAVQDSQHLVSKMDMDTIRSKAAKTAYDYEVQSVDFANKAQGFKSAAADADRAGTIGMISSFVGGAGSVAAKWMQASQFSGGAKSTNVINPAYDPLNDWGLGR